MRQIQPAHRLDLILAHIRNMADTHPRITPHTVAYRRRGVKLNPKTVAEIERLRRQLRDTPSPPATADTKELIAA